MSIELVQEAIGHTPIEMIPADDYVMIHPVTPDLENQVDLTIVKMGGADLPDMGVIMACGWKVNLGEFGKLFRELLHEDAEAAGLLSMQGGYAVGDVVVVNKFSGMDVPGTAMVLISRADVLGKLRNFPVRLKVAEDVAAKVRKARTGAIEPSPIMVP